MLPPLEIMLGWTLLCVLFVGGNIIVGLPVIDIGGLDISSLNYFWGGGVMLLFWQWMRTIFIINKCRYFLYNFIIIDVRYLSLP